MNPSLRDAIRDQLTDIRSSVLAAAAKEPLLDYALECIARCFEFLALEDKLDNEELWPACVAAEIAKVLAK